MIRGKGRIVHVIPDKGFGFIQSDIHDVNLFFHAKDLRNTRIEMLSRGDEVTFDNDIKETDKGLSCKDVRIVE